MGKRSRRQKTIDVEGLVLSERLSVARLLGEGRTPAKAIEMAKGTQTRARALLKEFAGVKTACKAGCAYCCSLLVTVAVPEVVRVAEHLRGHLPPEAFADVHRRVVELDDRIRGRSVDDRAAMRLPCALLVDNLCSIYPVRPLACIAWQSTDARSCERYWRRPSHDNPVTVDQAHWLVSRGAVQGMIFGLEDAGLTAEVEFTAALRLVLDNQDLVQAWLEGDRTLDQARVAASAEAASAVLRVNPPGSDPAHPRLR